MAGRGSKTKGDKYERELAAYINEKTGLESFRAPLSGGGKVGMTGGADILGTPELFIEAKRVERLNFHDAMRQAEKNVDITKSHSSPIVINRKSRMNTGDSLCLIRLDEFLKFYVAYLRLEGLTKK
jgi:Holliday junction resolvase